MPCIRTLCVLVSLVLLAHGWQGPVGITCTVHMAMSDTADFGMCDLFIPPYNLGKHMARLTHSSPFNW